MKLKKIMAGLMAMGLSLSLAACGNSASSTTAANSSSSNAATEQKAGDTISVVATSEEYQKLFDKFTKETGSKMELLSMSSGDVLSKVKAEGGAPSADLWFGGGIDAFMSARDEGLLDPFTFDAAKDITPEFKDKDGAWYTKGITVVGFLVNNQLLKEKKATMPKSWNDLTQPALKGEVIMSNPAASGTNYAAVNSILQTMGEEKGWKFFEGLNNNIAYYSKRGSDPSNKVGANEFAVGITYLDGSIDELVKANDLTVVKPADGMPWVPEGVAVFKNAKNGAGAKKFVEWLFSNDENLKLLAEIDKKNSITLIKPTVKGITSDLKMDDLMKLDLSKFGSQRKAILDKFQTLMGNKAKNE